MRGNKVLHSGLNAGLIAVVMFVGFSCSDDVTKAPPGVDLVTISGIVRNIDTFVPAEGVRISLLGTNYSDEVPTGSDGGYLLKVPRGSELILLAEDFDPSTDSYIPLIHQDVPGFIANEDLPNFPVHACPQTVCGLDTLGSLGIFDMYLDQGDQLNGDLFVPTSVADAAGTLAIMTNFCTDGVGETSAGMTYSFDAPEFPICYLDGNKIVTNDMAWFCPPDPVVAYPSTRTTTDDWGAALSWGDPAFVGDTVDLTIIDSDPLRAYQFGSPVPVAIRPGTITVVWVTAVAGIPDRPMHEMMACYGIGKLPGGLIPRPEK